MEGRSTRQAILLVSRQLLEDLMPDWDTCVQARYADMLECQLAKDPEAIATPYHTALKLPYNCRITGISGSYAFHKDQVAFRIESPDFIEMLEGNTLTEVDVVYQIRHGIVVNPVEGNSGDRFAPGQLKSSKQVGYFLRWSGPAVATQRFWGPDGKEVPVNALTPNELRALQGREKHRWSSDDPLRRVPSCINCGEPIIAFSESMRYCQSCIMAEQVPDPDGLPVGPLENDTDISNLNFDGLDTIDYSKSIVLTEPCWRCNEPTIKRLPDGTPECEKCASAKLL